MNTPLTLEQTQQNILALNVPSQPFRFSTADKQIIGTWDVDAHAQGLLNSESYKEHYTITVTLDEASHTYDYTEQSTNDNEAVGLLSAGSSHVTSSGKFVEKHYGMSDLLALGKSNAAAAHYTASFDNSQLKTPLFAALEQAGWHKKTGFFGRLFGKK